MNAGLRKPLVFSSGSAMSSSFSVAALPSVLVTKLGSSAMWVASFILFQYSTFLRISPCWRRVVHIYTSGSRTALGKLYNLLCFKPSESCFSFSHIFFLSSCRRHLTQPSHTPTGGQPNMGVTKKMSYFAVKLNVRCFVAPAGDQRCLFG